MISYSLSYKPVTLKVNIWKGLKKNSPAYLCLTQEVVGSDAVVVPNLQRQNTGLSKLRLLQWEDGLFLLIHHLFLQEEEDEGLILTKAE